MCATTKTYIRCLSSTEEDDLLERRNNEGFMEEIKPLPGRKNKGKQEGNGNGYIYGHNSETAYCWKLQFKETRG